MDCTWPVFVVSLDTGFDRWRPRRQPGPALLRDDYGRRLWGFRMDMDGVRDRAKLLAAAREINRQRAAGEDLRCGFCGMFQKRWDMGTQLRDGVEVFQCGGCAHAAWLGLGSRLELGSVPTEVRQ